MKKSEVKKIEDKARNIMGGSLFNLPKKLSIIYYYIFEDANFHTLNQELVDMEAYGKNRRQVLVSGTYTMPLSYGTPYAEKIYNDYRKSGGRTWNL